MARITAEDFTAILARVQAELSRRNGNGDLSGYANIDFPASDPVETDELVKPSALNTLLTGLGYINPAGLPESVQEGDYIEESTIDGIRAKVEVFEAQPRGAITGNDCASLCSGMCVSQCTTTCSTTCTGGCQDGCSTGCKGGCTDTCANNCTGSCRTSCTGGCSGSCTGSCEGDCYTGCDGCTNYCKRHCTAACAEGCGGSCKGNCDGFCTYTCKDQDN